MYVEATATSVVLPLPFGPGSTRRSPRSTTASLALVTVSDRGREAAGRLPPRFRALPRGGRGTAPGHS